MKLTELHPRFLIIEAPNQLRRYVDTLAEAQGILFLCPKCFEANGGSVGTHSVICWFLHRGVLDSEFPSPGRWEAVGTGFHDLTLQAHSSSILLTAGCHWHGFITCGDVTSC